MVASLVEFGDCHHKFNWVKIGLLSKIENGLSFNGFSVGGFVYLTRSEAVHDRGVCDEVRFLVLVAPCLRGDRLKRCEEVMFAFVVESLAISFTTMP